MNNSGKINSTITYIYYYFVFVYARLRVDCLSFFSSSNVPDTTGLTTNETILHGKLTLMRLNFLRVVFSVVFHHLFRKYIFGKISGRWGELK